MTTAEIDTAKLKRRAILGFVLSTVIFELLLFGTAGSFNYWHYLVFLTFKANSFASTTFEVATDQKVISTGPYGIVRHPMYLGALIALVGTPLSLGSWWGLIILIPYVPGIIWRLLDEEKFLSKNLQGYDESRQKVRYRLIPLLW